MHYLPLSIHEFVCVSTFRSKRESPSSTRIKIRRKKKRLDPLDGDRLPYLFPFTRAQIVVTPVQLNIRLHNALKNHNSIMIPIKDPPPPPLNSIKGFTHVEFSLTIDTVPTSVLPVKL